MYTRSDVLNEQRLQERERGFQVRIGPGVPLHAAPPQVPGDFVNNGSAALTPWMSLKPGAVKEREMPQVFDAKGRPRVQEGAFGPSEWILCAELCVCVRLEGAKEWPRVHEGREGGCLAKCTCGAADA